MPVKDNRAYLNAIECMNRCLLTVTSFSKRRMWEQRKRGVVSSDDLDLVIILMDFFGAGWFY
jgi:hypothetical protein